MPATIAAVWVVALLGAAIVWFAIQLDEQRKRRVYHARLHARTEELIERSQEVTAHARQTAELIRLRREDAPDIDLGDIDAEYEELCRRG